MLLHLHGNASHVPAFAEPHAKFREVNVFLARALNECLFPEYMRELVIQPAFQSFYTPLHHPKYP